MELNMHSLNNLRVMEVVDINLGAKLGYIRDLKIDCDESKIVAILIPVQKSNWFGKMDMLEIPWEDVVKIGVDVILVNSKEKTVSDM
ncbi:YlmC/YmxH family sporulation protein [Clostridium sp. YIM B02505]|uniref:YlmC/YmxH family sporulation protein n=1 Tax=Clostridium yunnanense TaxID=2800325 RepID=A0ABS1EWN4_9CLOT|nr:YlmC/YmxH family sporulation protein [Clostridium yunnanense]MBK1813795.1 YlmC/YmxH family sporulation protein [Clostridium yunnanense]